MPDHDVADTQANLAAPAQERPAIIYDDTDSSSSPEHSLYRLSTTNNLKVAREEDSKFKRIPFEAFEPDVEVPEKVTINPRQYQLELFERAKAGNVIACLDTGSGKTYIAVMLMEHINTEELKRCALLPGAQDKSAAKSNIKRKRSIFVVNMVPLVHQQAKVIDTQSYLRAARLFGDSAMGLDLLKAQSWEYLAHTGPYDVIVATAQVILDALNRAFITMDDFNLIVFDEAHHAIGSNSYARIMESHYHSCDTSKRPRIFAMTASPLNSKGSYADAAYDLQMILDAKIFTASRELRKEIEQWSSRPTTTVIEYDEPSAIFGDSDITRRMLEACEEKHPTAMKFINRIRMHDTEHGPLVATLAWHGSEKEFASRTERKIELLKQEAARKIAPDFLNDEYLARLKEYGEDAVAIQDSIYDRCRKHASEAAASAVIQSVLRDSPPVPDTVTADSSNVTPKVLKLLDLLETIGSQPQIRESFCGIIFVQTRRTAIALAELLKRIKTLQTWLKPDWLTGHAEQSNEGLDWARQQNVIRRFGKPGDLNVIVATNVVEEGLDVPPCNFVIRFDMFMTHVSYIQSKGRARHLASRFIVLVGHKNEEHKAILASVARTDMEIDQWLQRLPEDQKALPLLSDDDVEGRICGQKRKYSADHDLILHSSETDATIRPPDAVALLFYYASTLTSDSQVPLQPEFFVEKRAALRDDSSMGALPPQFRQTVHLPSNSKVRKVVGDWRPNKRQARQHAAFLCCQMLHQAGELDDRLLPRKKAKIVVTSKKAKRSAGRGTAAELQAFHAIEARMPSVFGSLPLESETNQGTKLHATLIKFIEFSPEARNVVLLTPAPIKSLPEVTLFTPEVHVIPSTSDSVEIELKEDEARCASRYTYIILCLMARLRSTTESRNSSVQGDESTLSLKSLPYYLLPAVPTHKSGDGSLTIDWAEAERCMHELFIEAKTICDNHGDEPEIWRCYTLLSRQTLLHNALFSLRKLRKDLTPTAAMPNNPGDVSFLDLEQARHRHTVLADMLDLSQPMLETARLPPRYNYLKDTRKNAQMFQSTDKGSKWLIPQLCYAIPVSSAMSTSATVLPSVLSRYEHILLARDLNETALASAVAVEHHLIAALTFPSADLPDSYDVLEFIGDSVLKLIVSNWVFCQNGSLDEGELTDAAADVLCNQHLAQTALRFGIAGYANAQRFNRKSWRPFKARKTTYDVSRKGLADLVEAILGAAWRSGGLGAANACAKYLDLFKSPLEVCQVVQDYLDKQQGSDDALAWQSRADAGGLLRLQEILQYAFKRPQLAFEACTHSTQLASDTPSYQRLEFLGDAVLDLLVVETLLELQPDLDEGQYTMKKSDAVCNASLSLACVQLGLHRFLRHGDPAIARAVAAYQLEVEYAQEDHKKKAGNAKDASPLSTRLNGPKMLADIVEALIGAIYVDTDFSFDVTRKVYNALLRPHIVQYI